MELRRPVPHGGHRPLAVGVMLGFLRLQLSLCRPWAPILVCFYYSIVLNCDVRTSLSMYMARLVLKPARLCPEHGSTCCAGGSSHKGCTEIERTSRSIVTRLGRFCDERVGAWQRIANSARKTTAARRRSRANVNTMP